MKELIKLFSVLSSENKRNFFLLLPMMAFVGIVEVVGVAFIVPFMMLVSNPTVIQSSNKIAWLYHFSHCTTYSSFLFFVGLLVFFLLLLGNAVSVLAAWLLFRFSTYCGSYFVSSLFAVFLAKPYEFFLKNNAAHLSSHVLEDGNHLLWNIIIPFVFMVSRIIGLFFVIFLVLWFQPGAAVILILVLGFSVCCIIFLVKKYLHRINNRRHVMQAKRSKLLSESLIGIKEIKVLGKEAEFYQLFSTLSRVLCKDVAVLNILGYFPRYLLEVFAFGGVVLVVLYLLANHLNTAQVISLLALYAFAGYRVMPGVQMIFSAVSSIKAFKSSINIFYQNMVLDNSFSESHLFKEKKNVLEKMSLSKLLMLENICFKYEGAASPTLKDFNMQIAAGQMVGLVGTTGAGKSTVIDIVMGLLTPQAGCMKVDDCVITKENNRLWQNNLGYVSQSLFLSDASILENIAFGMPLEQIDENRVKEVCQIAQINHFIEQELPNRYHTVVGERGLRLSGGQRQRLAIARALYRDPQVLVFDEATSALDSITETAIINAIAALKNKKTIIMITHRITTIKDCDVIYVLEKGNIKTFGSYKELMQSSEYFMALAKSNEGVVNND